MSDLLVDPLSLRDKGCTFEFVTLSHLWTLRTERYILGLRDPTLYSYKPERKGSRVDLKKKGFGTLKIDGIPTDYKFGVPKPDVCFLPTRNINTSYTP